jgi:hypothetical protein
MNQLLKFKTTPKRSGEYTYTTMEWDLSEQLDVDIFLKNNPEFQFEKAGTIVKNLKKTPSYEIQVLPNWKNKKFILYLLTINGKILKGGKSKNPLQKRTYGAGTEINWTMKGSPSDTNYIYSQIFRQCLENGDAVDFYCLQAPYNINQFNVFGEIKIIETSPYEEMESILNKKLIESLGRKPIGEGNLMEQFKK